MTTKLKVIVLSVLCFAPLGCSAYIDGDTSSVLTYKPGKQNPPAQPPRTVVQPQQPTPPAQPQQPTATATKPATEKK